MSDTMPVSPAQPTADSMHLSTALSRSSLWGWGLVGSRGALQTAADSMHLSTAVSGSSLWGWGLAGSRGALQTAERAAAAFVPAGLLDDTAHPPPAAGAEQCPTALLTRSAERPQRANLVLPIVCASPVPPASGRGCSPSSGKGAMQWLPCVSSRSGRVSAPLPSCGARGWSIGWLLLVHACCRSSASEPPSASDSTRIAEHLLLDLDVPRLRVALGFVGSPPLVLWLFTRTLLTIFACSVPSASTPACSSKDLAGLTVVWGLALSTGAPHPCRGGRTILRLGGWLWAASTGCLFGSWQTPARLRPTPLRVATVRLLATLRGITVACSPAGALSACKVSSASPRARRIGPRTSCVEPLVVCAKGRPHSLAAQLLLVS
mmetsp:Transcript_111937/g.316653  ORF Transcript_111937/g.316653 Transcript_111937/m.316653 type:complete len:377 (+) Transcript_111937:358-1488(+)